MESKQRVFELFETLNFLAENFVFSYIGLFLFTYDGHEWRPGFIVCSFLAIGKIVYSSLIVYYQSKRGHIFADYLFSQQNN